MKKFGLIQFQYIQLLPWHTMRCVGWDSIVGIVTRYGLDFLGIGSLCGRDFLHMSRPALRPTWYNGYHVLPGGLSGRRVALTTHTHLVPRLKKEQSIPLLLVWAFMACAKLNFMMQCETLRLAENRTVLRENEAGFQGNG